RQHLRVSASMIKMHAEGSEHACADTSTPAARNREHGAMRDMPAAQEDQAMIDETHSPARRSWVASANQHADFPIQNLPLCVFAPRGGAARGGVAIGDEIFDLAAALELGLFDGLAERAAQAACGAALNPLFALGREAAASATFSMPMAGSAPRW